MADQVKTIVSIYTESTPNPLTMKFVVNRMFTQKVPVDFQSVEEAGESPLALALYGFDYVTGVFFKNNFVTVTKTQEKEWHEVIPEIREFLRSYMSEDKPVFSEAGIKQMEEDNKEMVTAETEMEQKIVDLINQYVQPAVEMDGGSIVFKSFDEGVVTLGMQGACSGCPSSTFTLKNGIEQLLKRMLPEDTIKEVVAENM